MMKHVAILFAALLTACALMPAEARIRGGGIAGAPAPTAPILNSVAVNFGNYTRNGGGGVRLSSADDSTTYAVPVYGLGLMSASGTPCATDWTFTQTGGTNGHFNAYSGAEGTSAVTPVPSSAGVTAHLNGGPYSWNVTCKDASGNISNTGTFTYNIVADAATVDETIGNFPAVTSGYASFASTAGYKLLVPTGFKKLTPATWSIVCPTECTLTWADITKPGLFQSFNPNANQLTKLAVEDVTFTGDATQNVMNFAAPANAGTTLRLKNIKCKFTMLQAIAGGSKCLSSRWPGASVGVGFNIENFETDWASFGADFRAGGYRVKNFYVKNFLTNAMEFGNLDGFYMEDWLFWNPQVGPGGLHADCWQFGNGATVKNLTLKRGGCPLAGGQGPMQGPIFTGQATRGSGYIDNGAGGSGTKITLAPPVANPNAFFDPEKNGSQLLMPDCSITGATNARLSGSTASSGNLSNIPSQVCGSSGAPFDVATYSVENFNLQGIIYSGREFLGWTSNTSHGVGGLQNFAYINQVPQPIYTTTATNCTVSGTTLTCQAPTTSNAVYGYNAGVTAGGTGIGYVVTWPGITGATVTVTTRLSGSTYCNKSTDTSCSWTLSRAPGNVTGVTASFIVPVGIAPPASGPYIGINNSNRAWLHTGSQTLGNGFASGGCIFPLGGGSFGPPPANTTMTNCWNYTTAPPAANFDKGDPQVAFEAIPIATWNAMTPAQVIATFCSYTLAKPGGLLDNGGGSYSSPFKLVGGQGQWFDGTVVPGCN